VKREQDKDVMFRKKNSTKPTHSMEQTAKLCEISFFAIKAHDKIHRLIT